MSFTEHNVNGVIFDTAGTLSVGGVRHAFTTRHGGVSPAPFDSLNLASNRGDREENILENYRRLGAAVGFDASRAGRSPCRASRRGWRRWSARSGRRP